MNSISSPLIYTTPPRIQDKQISLQKEISQKTSSEKNINNISDGFSKSISSKDDINSLSNLKKAVVAKEILPLQAVNAINAAERAAQITANIASSLTPGPAGMVVKSLDDILAHELETAKAFYVKTDKVSKDNEENPLINNPNISFITNDFKSLPPLKIDPETESLASAFGGLTVNPKGLSDSDLKTVLTETGKHGLGATLKLMDEQKYLYRTAVAETQMTLAQKTALFAYTGDTYTVMNTALRTHDEERIKLIRPLIDKTVEALDTLPSFSGRVYRGGEMPQSFFDEHKPGAKVTYSAFTSTSANSGTAYGGNTHLIIDTANNNSAGKEISKLSMFLSENEILFPPDTDFIVTSHVEKDGKHIINMKELPKNK